MKEERESQSGEYASFESPHLKNQNDKIMLESIDKLNLKSNEAQQTLYTKQYENLKE